MANNNEQITAATHIARLKKVHEILETIKNIVTIKYEELNRKHYLKVYGGICDGIQVIECEDKQDATDCCFELYGFYKKMGKTVKVSM